MAERCAALQIAARKLCKFDMQLRKLLAVCRRGSASHKVHSLLRFGKRDHLADVWLAGEQHHHAVDARRNPAVWRRSKFKRLQHVAKALARYIHWHANQLKDALLHRALVDAN